MAAAICVFRSSSASGLSFFVIATFLPGTSSIVFRCCNFNPATKGTALPAFSLLRMSLRLFPDLPPPASPPAKPKITAEERRAREANRLKIIRLRMAIRRELNERGVTTPAAIGEALGMPPAEATKLITGWVWREGDIALLEAAVARLGVQVPPMTEFDARLRSERNE
jgi:hypothetical protein